LRFAAALVHLLTALGAVCALFALWAIEARSWEGVFAWLGLALFIDGIDGPFARLARVKERLPRFSGEQLDLVVDYLTYVFIPAYALLEAGFLEGVTGQGLAAAILVSSLYHFSDLESKSGDLSFVGFPAIWNIVAFYIFAFQAPPAYSAAVVVTCVVLTFVPMKWLHPVRVTAFRTPTLAAAALGTAAAGVVLVQGFEVASWTAKAVLLAVAVYAAGISAILTYGSRQEGGR
jgi:phosphatidylcholine synthase